jgi:hypothetical protein
MPVCLVFAAELRGKFDIGDKRLQGGMPQDALSSADRRVQQSMREPERGTIRSIDRRDQ